MEGGAWGPGGRCPFTVRGARRRSAQASAAADRSAALVLLPGDVPAAADVRAGRGGVVAGWAVAGLRDAGGPVAAACGWVRGRAAHRLRPDPSSSRPGF